MITRDIAKEDRFEFAQFLLDHDVAALVNVPIFLPGRRPFGVLQVDSRSPRDFGDPDIEFLKAYAMILGPAIDRLRTKVALQAADERLQLIEKAKAYVMIITDAQDRITDWLGGSEAILGWSAEEVIGQPGEIIFTNEDRAAGVPASGLKRARERGIAPDVRWHQGRDGKRVYLDAQTIAISHPDGGIRSYLRIGQDVTKRMETEAALKASEERLRQFGEASQDILWMRDARTLQWQYLTPAFESIYGLDRQDALVGDNFANWISLIVAEDRERVLDAIARVRSGEHMTFDYRIRRPVDGGIRWLRNTDFPIHDSNGDLRVIGGVGHDLTELRETQLRMQVLMEVMPQLVWRAMPSGGWTWSSPQWANYTGLTEDDSMGDGWLDAFYPEDRDRAREAWAEALETGEFEVEARIHDVAGHYRWFKTSALPVRDNSGQIVEWLGTSTDIHQIREMQGRQQVLVAELQHRTRNLMAVVMSMAEKSIRSSADLADFRGRFGSRLQSLANVQALLSRLSDIERVTFDELIDAEMSALDGAAEQTVMHGPKGVRLRSSTVQTLAMAIHELATNVLKYGALSQKGAKLEIRWTHDCAEGRAPRLNIDWRETGVELPAGERPRGHGREPIERALPYQLDASTHFSLEPDGVHCTISLPVSTS